MLIDIVTIDLAIHLTQIPFKSSLQVHVAL